MALDFPNAPTLNQTFTAPNGTIWLWDGVKWAATTSASPFTGQGNVGRNLLHNPLFNVAQRGPGPWTTNGVYTADRWVTAVSLDTVNFTTGADITDAVRTAIGDESIRTYLSNTFTGNAGASSINYVCQRIEDVRRLAGKTVTVSFWAAASAALKLGVSISQLFGTGGSPSAILNVNGVAVQLTTAWGTRYSVTIAVPSISGKTLGTNGDSCTQLNLWYSCGTTNAALAGSIGVQSGTIVIAGVQLEIGSVATPLEKPDPRYDLANCQRFYQSGQVQIVNYLTAANQFIFNMNFQTTMRATPTMVVAPQVSTNCTGGTIAAVDVKCMSVASGNATATGPIQWVANYTASADL